MLNNVVPTPVTRADLYRWRSHRVDDVDVLIGQIEINEPAPVTAEFVLPDAGAYAVSIEFDDQAGLGTRDVLVTGVRRGHATGHKL